MHQLVLRSSGARLSFLMDFGTPVTNRQSVPRIQFYVDPPTHTIELEHLEQFAIERLKVLKCVETVGQDFIRGSKEYNERLSNELYKLGSLGKSFTLTSRQPKNIVEDIHKDVTSHFILQVCMIMAAYHNLMFFFTIPIPVTLSKFMGDLSTSCVIWFFIATLLLRHVNFPKL